MNYVKSHSYLFKQQELTLKFSGKSPATIAKKIRNR